MGDNGSLRKSAYWDGNGKKVSGRWPSWDGTRSKAFGQDHENGNGSWNQSQGWTASGDDNTMVFKKDWNDSEDVKAKRELSEGDTAFYLDGIDGWRQSNHKINMGDKGNLRKSAYWDRPADGNGKKESGGWPGWDCARSKAVGKYTHHQNGNGAWNQSQERIALEDGTTITGKGVWHEFKDGKAKKETREGGSRKSACWDRPEDGNDKKESDGWPSWDGASSKTIELYVNPKNGKASWNQSQGWTASEDDTTMACKKGWNDFEDVKAKRDLSECGDTFYLDGIDGWRQSNPKINMVDNVSLRKSAYWGRSADGNGKKESGEWPSWNGARSKAVGKYTHHQKRGVWNQDQELIALEDGTAITDKGGWNESEDDKAKKETSEGGLRKSACWDRPEDANDKKESGGWPSWDGSSSMTIGLCTHPKNLKGSLNQTQGWNSEGVKAKRELSEGGNAFYLDGIDGWSKSNPKINMVDGTAITGKGGWNESEDDKAKKETSDGGLRKSACWDTPEDANDKKESGGWPSWDGASSMTIGLCTYPKNGKGSLNPTQGWNSEGVKAKRELSEGGNAFYLDGIDGWSESNPKINMVDKCNLRKSTYWNRATDGNGKESGRRSSWNGARFNSLGKYTSHQNGIDNLNQSQGWNALKDGTTREDTRGASTDYRDSPRWLSRRGRLFRRGIGNAVRQYSDRDIEGFRDNKKARYRGNDRWINTENPWKQRNHLKDTLTPRHERRFHGVEGSNFSGNDSSYDGCNYENTGMVSSWNCLKIPNATVTDQLRQSHMMIGNVGFRGETLKPTSTSPKQNADQGVRNSHHVWKIQQKYYVSQQTPQDTDSLPDNQNDQASDSAIQLGQNMQVNSQLPSCLNRSNPKVEMQNHEQQAMSKGELLKKNGDICEASTALDLNVLPITTLSSFYSFGGDFIQVNEDSSSSNLRSTPVSIKPSKTSEELKSNSTKLASIDKNLNTSTHSVTTTHQNNQSWDLSHRDSLDDKGIRMFKAALVEFVKNIIKPIWKEGGLSKEAHKIVVKKVVDKVTGVLGSNIPQTQEMIDQYMSFANAKLHKLTQDYLEMFINT